MTSEQPGDVVRIWGGLKPRSLQRRAVAAVSVLGEVDGGVAVTAARHL